MSIDKDLDPEDLVAEDSTQFILKPKDDKNKTDEEIEGSDSGGSEYEEDSGSGEEEDEGEFSGEDSQDDENGDEDNGDDDKTVKK